MAGKINSETLALNIDINGGDKARKEMNELSRAIQDTSAAIDELTQKQKKLEAQGKKESSTYKAVTKSIEEKNRVLAESKTKLAALERQQSVSSMTISELNKRIRELNSVLSKTDPRTPRWKELNDELRNTRSRLLELTRQSKNTNGVLFNMAERINRYIGLITAGFATMGLAVTGINRARKAWSDYDESLVDAMKTTNLSREEVEELSAELAKLDTRTSQNDLLELARIGGKLGITGKENILEFVRAADQINVALGRDLGSNTEDAIREIGKLVDIFDLQEEYGLEQSLLKVGSAINELGMSSTANEGYIVDFTKRLAGVAPNADIAIEDVLGMAATLDKYGQMTETSSTAITQAITGMFGKTATFAKVAKMPVEDFTRLLEEDVNEAFLRVLEGMRQGGSGMREVTAALNSMQLDGQRATTVLGSLAKHSDELRRQQELAKKAFDDGTSASNEFGIKNESVTAIIEKHKKAIVDQARILGEQLNPLINQSLSLTTHFIKLLGQLISLGIKYKGVIIGLVAAYGTYIAVKTTLIAKNKVLAVWRLAGIKQTALETTGLVKATSSTYALCAAKAVLTGHFRTAARAAKAFWISLGPIGQISMAFGVLVGAVYKLVTATRELSAEEQVRQNIEKRAKEVTDETGMSLIEKADRIKTYMDRINDSNTAESVRIGYIRELNELLPEEIGLIDEKGEAIGKLSAKIYAYQKLLRLQSDKEGAEKGRDKLITQYAEEVRTGENKKTKGFWRRFGDYFSYMGATQGGIDPDVVKEEIVNRNVQKAEKRYNNLLAEYEAQIEDFNRQIEENEAILNPKKKTKDTDWSGGNSPQNSDSDSDYGGQWSLDSDVEFIKKRTELRNKYVDGEISTETELNEKISDLETEFLNRRLKTLQDIMDERVSLQNEVNTRLTDAEGRSLTDKEQREIDSLNSRIENMQKVETEILKIEDELADRSAKKRTQRDAEKHEDDQENLRKEAEVARLKEEIQLSAIDKENQRYENEKKKYTDNAEALELVEQKHQRNLTKIKLDEIEHRLASEESNYRLARKAMVNRHKQELRTFEGSKKAKQKLIQEQNTELLQLDMEYLNKMKTQLEGIIGSGTFDGITLDTNLISEEEMRKFKEQLQEILTLINGGEADSGSSRREKKGGSLFGVSQEDWEGFFNGDFDTGAFIDALQGMVGEAMNIYSMWADKQAAVERKLLKEYKENNDKKKSALEDRLNAGLMTEAQYNAEVEALDAQYEAYEEEMELKQAKRQKAQKISEAVINTALGVSKTLAEWGIPWGLAPAAVMAAMGAAQIAIIAKTPVMTGMAEGGLFDVVREQDGRRFPARLSPERRGFIDRPTVLVGEAGGEYVIPAEGLANPTLAPLIATIEGARRNGTLRRLNMEAVYPASVSIPGRAEGGYTGTAPKVEAAGNGGIDPRMAVVLEKLLKKLDDPVKAYVSVLGKNGIKEAYDKYENQKNRGTL